MPETGRGGRPPLTDVQRELAVALLANAIRKAERLGERRAGPAPAGPAPIGRGRDRAAAARRYAEGMRDLLAVLFAGGRAAADECFEAARIVALGGPGEADDG